MKYNFLFYLFMDYKKVFEETKYNITNSTKENYLLKMSKMMRIYKDQLTYYEDEDIYLPSYKTIYDDSNISLPNKYAYMNTLSAYIKHKGMKRDINGNELYKDVYKQLCVYDSKADKRELSLNVDNKSMQGLLTQLIKDKKWYDALIIGMFTLMEQFKIKYNTIRITDNIDIHNKLIDDKINHIYNNDIYIMKDKIHKESIPITLAEIINNSFNENKRDYLFVNNKNEVMNCRNYALYINKKLKKITKDPNIIISDLRNIRLTQTTKPIQNTQNTQNNQNNQNTDLLYLASLNEHNEQI